MISAVVLLSLVLGEDPSISQRPATLARWQKEMEAASVLQSKVASAGMLVSPEVDERILAAVGWYEARNQTRPNDGDCHWQAPSIATGPGPQVLVCDAFGPLQLAKSNIVLVLRSPEAKALGLPAELTLAQARDPEAAMRLGYAALAMKKRECGGQPGEWLTAYGWGKCPPRGHLDWEGVRRCALADALLERDSVKPEGWVCGHEKRKVKRAHDRRIIQLARGMNATR